MVRGEPLLDQQPGLKRVISRPESRMPPPQTLDEQLRDASIVILGEVVSERQYYIGSAETFITPMIEHTVRVIQVLKAPPDIKPGSTVPVSQPGGAVVVGSQEVVHDDRNFPVFRQGDRLVLFLIPDGRGLYSASHASAGVFRVSAGHVAIPVAARLSDQRKKDFPNESGMPLGQFLNLLRGKIR
jgi:hypothetical protein